MSSNEMTEKVTFIKTSPYSLITLPPVIESDFEAFPSIPWQTVQKLDKNFKFWPGFVQASNFLAKIGAMAFLPNDMRPTVSLLVDNATDVLYASPYKMGHAVENVLDDLNIELPRRNRRRKFNEAKNFCTPCFAENFTPQKIDIVALKA